MVRLDSIANELRKDIIRATGAAGSGHPGGSLSAIDILTVLYYKQMAIMPENYHKQDRDFFILSKGHAAPALYAVLASKGFFSKEELLNLRKFGSILQGHPDKLKTPGVDASSGSLGQGLSIGNGIALAKKIDQLDNHVFILVGDGELQEGQIWEAAMTAAHYNLDNVIVLVDHNHLQIDGTNDEVMKVNDIGRKFASFNWRVLTSDGHDLAELNTRISEAKVGVGRPTVIICETVKGKGVSFMENEVGWHGKAPSSLEVEQALNELAREDN